MVESPSFSSPIGWSAAAAAGQLKLQEEEEEEEEVEEEDQAGYRALLLLVCDPSLPRSDLSFLLLLILLGWNFQ